MKSVTGYLLFPLFVLTGHIATAQDITFFFETDDLTDGVATTLTGGSLVLTDAGSGPTNTWLSDRFEHASSTFEVQSIPTIGTLTVTATSLVGDLNITSSGLSDGSSGYGATGEGTSFTFSEDVTITMFDFSSFTSGGGDTVDLSVGTTLLGTFSDDTVVASVADFTNPNNVSASISVSAGDAFTLTYQAGNFSLEEISFSVLASVPEANFYSLIVGISGLFLVVNRRRA